MAFVLTAQVLPPPLAPPYAVYSVRLLKNSSCFGFACPGSQPISVLPLALFCFAMAYPSKKSIKSRTVKAYDPPTHGSKAFTG